MTNAVKGLRGRLNQFDSTVQKTHFVHGGAERLLYKHQNYSTLSAKLFVALHHFECKPAEITSRNLRIMGLVPQAEYEAMADFVDLMGKLPEFNRKKESKKYRAMIGKQK